MTIQHEGTHMAIRYPNLTTKGAGANGTGVYLEIGLLHLQRDLRELIERSDDDAMIERLTVFADTLDRMAATLQWQTPQGETNDD